MLSSYLLLALSSGLRSHERAEATVLPIVIAGGLLHGRASLKASFVFCFVSCLKAKRLALLLFQGKSWLVT